MHYISFRYQVFLDINCELIRIFFLQFNCWYCYNLVVIFFLNLEKTCKHSYEKLSGPKINQLGQLQLIKQYSPHSVPKHIPQASLTSFGRVTCIICPLLTAGFLFLGVFPRHQIIHGLHIWVCESHIMRFQCGQSCTSKTIQTGARSN